MYRLRNWYLETYADAARGHGFCYNNPKFYSGQFITTSYIVKIEVVDDERLLKLFTYSGSCYVLDYADINEMAIESTEKVLEKMGVALDLQRCVACKENRLKSTEVELMGRLDTDELYVVMAGGYGVAEAYFKSKDNVIVPIHVNVHIGMTQDSVIVADFENGLCDWRIFPNGYYVKPYHWSDNIKAVHICNIGEDFIFKGSKREIPCESGGVTVIKSEEYGGEGLFSPDAVNGKCAFNPNPEE